MHAVWILADTAQQLGLRGSRWFLDSRLSMGSAAEASDQSSKLACDTFTPGIR